MRASSLKEGIILTPKSKHYICEIDLTSLDKSEKVPWIIISQMSIMKSTPGAGETLMYLRTIETQLCLPVNEDALPADNFAAAFSSQRKCYHEVLWRGTVYRIRNNTLRRLSIIKSHTAKKREKKCKEGGSHGSNND